MKIFCLLLVVSFFLFINASSATTTVAILRGSSTICAIAADRRPRTIHCWRDNLNFSINPQVSFGSISSNGELLCGVTSDGRRLFCWNPTSRSNSSSLPPPKRLYNRDSPLSNLAVGEKHVAAVEEGNKVLFWRLKEQNETDGKIFESLASGNGFTCGINGSSSSVRCWGGDVAVELERRFNNESMRSLAAGEDIVCGVTTAGELICGGKSATIKRFGSPFEFYGAPAVGKRHICALSGQTSTVTCWNGGNRTKIPMRLRNASFVSIVAGGDLTCGLLSYNLTLVCWNLNGSLLHPSLPKVLPGPCERNCSCGIPVDSAKVCQSSGEVLCKPCDPPPSLPPPPTGSKKRSRLKYKLLLAVGIIGSFAGVCSIIHCLWIGLCRRRKVHNTVQPRIAGDDRRRESPTPAPLTPSASLKSLRSCSASSTIARIMRQRSGTSAGVANAFSLLDLALATENFSRSAQIGSGSFGTIYRGKLPDGREVAIKRSETGGRPNRQGERESEFHSELSFLSRLHHKHLVPLLGFCEEGSERLLVYEYMSNGSLYQHLHATDHRLNDSPIHYSWRLRIKLLLDAARGIEYLHHYAVPPIIHRDIKPSNILIDGTWTARISDFGLSLDRLDLEGEKKAGTIGYMDPEYYGMHMLSEKSDVYGFGVVMLEMLTGKKAIFRCDGGLTNVVDYAWGSVAEGEVGRVLDRRVVALVKAREAEAIELVAYTAVRCVSLVGNERPSMRDVVANLEAALNLWDESANGSADSASILEDSLD